MCYLALCFLAAVGSDEPQKGVKANQVFTPAEVIAKAEELNGNGTTGRSPIRIRFRVGSIGTQTVTDDKQHTFDQILLRPVAGETQKASFHVAIAPECEKELKQLGVVDFKKHFVGKQVEVEGRFDIARLNLYASEQFLYCYVTITKLEQVRSLQDIPATNDDR